MGCPLIVESHEFINFRLKNYFSLKIGLNQAFFWFTIKCEDYSGEKERPLTLKIQLLPLTRSPREEEVGTNVSNGG